MTLATGSEDGRVAGKADDRTVGPFLDVYVTYSPVVRDFLLSRAAYLSRSDLPNLVQEVFARLWQHRGRFRGDSSAKTYILGIARNVLQEDRRARRRRAAVPFDSVEHEVESGSAQAGKGIERQEMAEAIERAKARLSPEQREAFELVHVLGLPVSEATRMAKCRPNQFRNRLYRARKVLRELLKDIAIGVVLCSTLLTWASGC